MLDYAGDEEVDPASVSAFESITGKGVRGDIDGTTYYAGKPDLFDELGVDLSQTDAATDGGVVTSAEKEGSEQANGANLLDETIPALQDDGLAVVLIGTEEAVLGVIAIADEVRPEAARTIERLHDRGIAQIVMLTGDNEGTARAIAEQVGVDDYRAALLPDEKVAAIEELGEEYGSVAMVGDGIDDAPAMATASLGIVMGAAGTDAALETADIALMGDDLSKLPYLYALSNKANRVIRQNIWVSLGAKALLAVGVPLGLVSVALAVVAGDMGMSLGVTGNALRLSRMDPE